MSQQNSCIAVRPLGCTWLCTLGTITIHSRGAVQSTPSSCSVSFSDSNSFKCSSFVFTPSSYFSAVFFQCFASLSLFIYNTHQIINASTITDHATGQSPSVLCAPNCEPIMVVMQCDVAPYQLHTSYGRMAVRSQFQPWKRHAPISCQTYGLYYKTILKIDLLSDCGLHLSISGYMQKQGSPNHWYLLYLQLSSNITLLHYCSDKNLEHLQYCLQTG